MGGWVDGLAGRVGVGKWLVGWLDGGWLDG